MDNIHGITEEEIQKRAFAVFAAMQQRSTPQEMELIRKAFNYAREAHREQRRRTGEPYIIHPIAVALIIAQELKLGAAPVCAAFCMMLWKILHTPSRISVITLATTWHSL